MINTAYISLILTAFARTSHSRSKISFPSQISLSSIFKFLHTIHQNSCINMFIMHHWWGIKAWIEEFGQESCIHKAWRWTWKLQIKLDLVDFNCYFVHKASNQDYWSGSGSYGALNTRIWSLQVQVSWNSNLLFCLFIAMNL
jgi:hypothetical protein